MISALTETPERLSSARARLLDHPIYAAVFDLPRLQVFMRSHVFAVWDFMTLLKRLQRDCCRQELPWMPPFDPKFARFVNEIVLGEESDEDGHGGYCSHFELYLQAMDEVGADRGPIDTFLARLGEGDSVEAALAASGISDSTGEFVKFNLSAAEEAETHEVAAIFCYGREDIIPEMFERLLERLPGDLFPEGRFRFYLDRHIELDADAHGPLARRLVEAVCQGDDQRRSEAAVAAAGAVEARIRLWDGLMGELDAVSPALV
ncbi:MAG: DUF3050 domain-containing protein [Maioricimonas sp. JB045]